MPSDTRYPPMDVNERADDIYAQAGEVPGAGTRRPVEQTKQERDIDGAVGFAYLALQLIQAAIWSKAAPEEILAAITKGEASLLKLKRHFE